MVLISDSTIQSILDKIDDICERLTRVEERRLQIQQKNQRRRETFYLGVAAVATIIAVYEALV